MEEGEKEEKVEEKIPTPEEQLEAIRTELTEAQTKLEQSDKGLRTAHQTLTEKDKRLKQLEGEKGDVSALSAKVEVLGGIMAEYLGSQEEANLEELPPKKKVDLAKKFQEVEASSRVKTQIEPRQRRAEVLGIPMEDKRIKYIEYLATTGDYKGADDALDVLETELKATREEAPKETEGERAENYKKDVDEAARKLLEESGQLKTDTGVPSASSGSFMEFERKYIAGEVSKGEYEKRARAEGKI